MTHELPPNRPRRRSLSPDEVRIWRAVVRDVAPLPGRDAALPEEALPPPVVTPPPLPEPPVFPPLKSVAAPLPSLRHGSSPGVDKRTAQRLQRGDMVVDARLDLHGLSQDSAHAALLSFVGRAYESGRRCLLVITGKGREGGGVLRAQVPRWLNDSPLRERVLSFSYARPRDGGDGALYILVKRRR